MLSPLSKWPCIQLSAICTVDKWEPLWGEKSTLFFFLIMAYICLYVEICTCRSEWNLSTFFFPSTHRSSRECWPITGSDHRAFPAAGATSQTHCHRRVQKQHFSDVATQRSRGWSCCHLLHHWGLQVRFTDAEITTYSPTHNGSCPGTIRNNAKVQKYS